VAGRDDLGAINDFISELGVGEFDHAVDDDGSLWADFGIASQPAFIFIDDSGEMTTHQGALGEDGLAERLDELAAT